MKHLNSVLFLLFFVLCGSPLIASETESALQTAASASYQMPVTYWLAPAGAILALAFALLFYKGFMRSSEGEPEMVRVAQAVRDGAYAYLSKQRNMVAIVFVALILVLVFLAYVMQLQAPLTPLGVAIAGILSGLCGYLGMKTATNASARTTHAAKQSLNDGLKVAFRAGAVMGLCVTGFALLDISVWFFVLTKVLHMEEVSDLVHLTTITLSFAMGASLQALFARVGGGIYTKAADVGADLVGKVEAGIPEDDARNPAAIADNVGDNVGDVAGMGADLYESYYGSILAAMALAAAAAVSIPEISTLDHALRLVLTAPALAGLGIACSIFAIFTVKAKEKASFAQLLRSLHTGVWTSSALIVIGGGALFYFLLGDLPGVNWIGVWGAIVSGLVAGLVIAFGTEVYTSYEHKHTQHIAEQAETGAATVIIAGVAKGMISTWVPLVTTVVAIMLAFISAGGGETFLLGVFGVAIAAVGMLSTLGITLATDAYGPIADNAGGNAEMTQQPPEVRERTDMLDSLGNTTAATGKGFAIGSAALTALALLAAYVITVQSGVSQQALKNIARQDGQVEKQLESQDFVYLGNGIVAQKDEEGEVHAAILLDPEQRKELDNDKKKDEPVALASAASTDVPTAPALKVKTVPVMQASLPQLMNFYDVTLMNPRVLCGLFMGVMLVFVFCALTMSAVGRAAFQMMQECRRQFDIMKRGFKQDGLTDEQISVPTQWPLETNVEGKKYPDYASCVAISTGGALKEMVAPSVLAVVVPIIVGLILGVAGVMGLLAGTLVCGFAVAIFMANAGGAWDNAKKYIETGKHGGKGSDAHKAGVVGDTVGDPFKDTSGPSLNILIKLVSVVSVVFAGVIVQYANQIANLIGLY